LRFRLLIDGPAQAAHNMAVDEALYQSALQDGGIATLRLYRFHPSAVSFGYRQQVDEVVDRGACRALGIDWVRRPTGGRALLHQHELTYCVTAPARGPLGGRSVRDVYETVSDSIRLALERLGAPLDPPAPWERMGVRADAPVAEPCLAVPGRHEITSRGRKLVASAQRRNSRCFLQHGAILRSVDPALWSRIAPPAPSPPLHAIGLDDLVPGLTETDVVEALRAAFEERFGGPASRESLLPSETALLPRLIEKYRSLEWSLERRAPPQAETAGLVPRFVSGHG
jgi:lipoyl(octanoyl) transferase